MKRIKCNFTSVISGLLIMQFAAATAWSLGVSYDFDTVSNFNIAWNGSSQESLLGRCGVETGDLNGDGIQDLVIAEYMADTQSLTNNGAVYVIYGPISAAAGTAKDIVSSFNVRIDGAETDEHLGQGHLGWYMPRKSDEFAQGVHVLDVNGDNQEDLVLRTAEGKAYFIYGPLPDGTGTIIDLSNDSNYNFRILPPSGIIFSGIAYVRYKFADVNDDGDMDILVEAERADNGGTDRGSLYVLYGPHPAGQGITKDMGIASDFNLRFDGHINTDYLGHVKVGDLTGDGITDLVISAYYADFNGSASGSVYVFTGFSTDETTGHIYKSSAPANWAVRFNGPTSNAYLGRSCEIADLNADGNNDLIMGADAASAGGLTSNGAAYVVYGPLAVDNTSRDLSTAENFNVRFDGRATSIYFANVLRKGDTNNDGIEDIIMVEAANADQGSGMVFIVYGGTGWPTGTGNTKDMAVSSSYNVSFESADTGTYTYEYLGYVLKLEDLDGDGILDMIMPSLGGYRSAYLYPSGKLCRKESYAGIVYVRYGPTPSGTANDIDFAVDYHIRYVGACTITGNFIAVADLDGDGIKEIVMSNHQSDIPNQCQGRVYMVSTANPAPKIISPGLFVNVTNPTVEWTSVLNGDNYRIQVDETPIFSSPVCDDTVAATTKGLSGLINAETYYARVKSTDGDYQRWGPIVTFTVDTTAPVPGLISPGDASGTHPAVDTSTPTFKWSEGSTE